MRDVPGVFGDRGVEVVAVAGQEACNLTFPYPESSFPFLGSA
jgi:hypothetical protein